MSSAHSLKSLVISKFDPEQMRNLIHVMEKLGYDFKIIIESDLAKYNTTIDFMDNFNKDYTGWWGCPHRIAAYTIKPELIWD